MRLAILALAIALAPPTARAQPDAAAGVEVIAVGEPAGVGLLEVVIRDLASGEPYTLRWALAEHGIESSDVLRDRSPDPSVLARAWIDLSDPERWRLYVADGPGERFLVRVLERGDSSDEVLRESLGRILASTLHAIQAGLAIGTERAIAEGEVRAAMGTPAPEPISEPIAPPIEPPPVVARAGGPELRAGVLYEAALLHGAPVVDHGPGIALAIASGPRAHAAVVVVSVVAGWRVPLEWDRGSYGARFDGAALRATAAAELRLADVLAVELGAGLGADLLRFAPRAGPEAIALPPRLVALPIARVAAGVTFRAGALTIPVRVGLDVDLSGTRYTVQHAGGEIAILSPWIARPFVHAGVSVGFE